MFFSWWHAKWFAHFMQNHVYNMDREEILYSGDLMLLSSFFQPDWMLGTINKWNDSYFLIVRDVIFWSFVTLVAEIQQNIMVSAGLLMFSIVSVAKPKLGQHYTWQYYCYYHMGKSNGRFARFLIFRHWLTEVVFISSLSAFSYIWIP